MEREEHSNPLANLQAVISIDEIKRLQSAAQAVDVARSLKEYIVRLNQASRAHPDLILGVSPRGGVGLQRMAQALALLQSRTFVTPDDIRRAAPAVLAHRVFARDRRIESARDVIASILRDTTVPAF